MATKVFKSGNAMAVRLPASFKAVAGTAVEVREEQGKWIVEPVAKAPRKFDIDKVWGSAIGSGLQPIDPDDRWFEERALVWDDPEWRAKHMPDA
jgi:antitoxin VapB